MLWTSSVVFKIKSVGQACWYTPIIPALRRSKQKDHEFEASLGYTARTCLKKRKRKFVVLTFVKCYIFT
jgi:hypothetical protein